MPLLPFRERRYLRRFNSDAHPNHGVIVTDREGVIRFVSDNQPLVSLGRVEPKSLVGRDLTEVFSKLFEAVPDAKNRLSELLKTKTPFSLQFSYASPFFKQGRGPSKFIVVGHAFPEGKGGFAFHTVYRNDPDLKAAAVDVLIHASKLHDPQLKNHGRLVSFLSLLTAPEFNLSKEKQANLQSAALLHDVGKLVVPIKVLLKRSKLSAREKVFMQTHPPVGAEMVREIIGAEAARIIEAHHMMANGSNGYPLPEGVAPGHASLEARILKVADAYASLLTKRSYHRAWKHEAAIAELESKAGRDYDAKVVEAFKRVLEANSAKVDAAFEKFNGRRRA
ncbi:MAG: HD domain-containing phosphohydrolase [Candidatus Micrarchaeia archaeon]